MQSIDNLKFDKDGLIPAIVQDSRSGEVLMVAYMNKESLEITLKEKTTCFWSRSRKELWRKGSTSGNKQQVVSLTADCDSDALLVKVTPDGPACHTGSVSCFFNGVYSDKKKKGFSIRGLYSLITGRLLAPKENSYTSRLFAGGKERILKKVGEESSEVIIAAMKDNKGETVYEIADLCYHLLVLMANQGITPDDIIDELALRHTGGEEEKG